MTPALWIAGGAFGVAVIIGLLILAPWTFHSAMTAGGLVAWGDQGHPRHAQERDLALHVEKQVDDNARRAATVQWAVLAVVLAVAVEFGALAYQLISRSS